MIKDEKSTWISTWWTLNIGSKFVSGLPSYFGWFDAQITQTLKFKYAQYMDNHGKTIFGPSNSKTPTAHYAIDKIGTHGPTYYPCVNTPTLKA